MKHLTTTLPKSTLQLTNELRTKKARATKSLNDIKTKLLSLRTDFYSDTSFGACITSTLYELSLAASRLDVAYLNQVEKIEEDN